MLFDLENPADTRYWAIGGSMLGQCRRRWANIEPAMAQGLVCAGKTPKTRKWLLLQLIVGNMYYLNNIQLVSFSIFKYYGLQDRNQIIIIPVIIV